MAKLPGPSESLPVPQGSSIIPRVPTDPTGQALSLSGNILTNIAGDLREAFAAERERVNKARVEDAYTTLRKSQLELSLGEEGFKQVKGGEAIRTQLLKRYSERFHDVRSRIAKDLNEEQRKAFNQRADIAEVAYKEDILQHLAEQNRVYQGEVKDATLEVETRSAGRKWNSPGDVKASLVRTRAAVNAYAEANGISGVVLENLQQQATSKIHGAVIAEALAAKNLSYAKLYFDTHREEMDENLALRMGGAIAEGTFRADAQSRTDQIVARHKPEDALVKAREISDPELRDEVVRRVTLRINEDRSLDAQAESEAADTAWKIVTAGGGRDAIPETVWKDMRGIDRREVNEYLQREGAEVSAILAVQKRLDGDDSVIVPQKKIDEVYAKQYAKAIPKQGANAYKAAFVERMKYVPAQVESEVVNGLRSGNVEMIRESADLLDRIDHIPRLVADTFSTQDRAFGQQVVSLLSYLPAPEAIALARKNTDPSDAARIEARQRVIKEEKWSDAYPSKAASRFDDTYFGTTVDPVNADRLARDFGELTEAYYLGGMDRKAAEVQAEKDMRRVWGVSEVTGKARTMRYPPELFYGTSERFSEQLKADVEKLWGGPYDAYFLIADDTTARDASAGRPTYRIVVQDERGLNPVVGVRWHPDVEAAAEATMEENRALMAEERQQRKGQPGAARRRRRRENAAD